jgi:hypothetical protein
VAFLHAVLRILPVTFVYVTEGGTEEAQTSKTKAHSATANHRANL